MNLAKEIVISLFLVGAGYLLGRKGKQVEDLENDKESIDEIFKAQKKALNLTDADCDALQRMYDKWKR